MKQTYSRTLSACYTGYVVQAIVNNFIPLLFLTFQSHLSHLHAQHHPADHGQFPDPAPGGLPIRRIH